MITQKPISGPCRKGRKQGLLYNCHPMQWLFKQLARLPLAWWHALGAALGWVAYRSSPRYASRLRENLARSGVCAGDAECRALLRQTVAEAGKGVAEVFPVWLRPLPKVLDLVRDCRGWEAAEAAFQAGKGVIFLTPHLGCFEICSLYIAARHPLAILYRPPKLGWLEPFMAAGRARGQVTLASTDLRGVRTLLKALKRGEGVGILPDQVPSRGDGAWADFFGRPAYTMTLVQRLQQATGAAIVLVFAERLPHGRGYTLRFERLADELPADPAASARALNAAVEDLIRRTPAQYLWSYNRYKAPHGSAPESMP